MPPGKSRPKDDTWTPEQLNEALKGTRDGIERKRHHKGEEDRTDSRRRSEAKGNDSRQHKDDSRRSHKRDENEQSKSKLRSRGDFSPEPLVELTEEEREKLRQERREKRGGKSEKKEERHHRKEEKPDDSDDNTKRKHRDRDNSERRHRRDAIDSAEEKRHHEKEAHFSTEDGERRRRNEGRESDPKEEEDERERRRQERRELREKGNKKVEDSAGEKREKSRSRRERDTDEGQRDRKEHHKDRQDRDYDAYDEDVEKYRREKHKDKDKTRDERHKDRDRDEKHKDRDRLKDQERNEKQRDRGDHYKDREEKHRERKDRHKDKDKDREEKHKVKGDHHRSNDAEREDKEREREERKRREREKEKEEQRREKEKEEQRREEKDQKISNLLTDDNYNEYEDDFEDYEEDFESEEELKKVHDLPKKLKNDAVVKNDEVDEVLKALDAENARLTSLSERSNWSSSTELSDERFRDMQDDYSKDYKRDHSSPAVKPSGRSFINFVSAKQRVMNQTMASKTRRRAEDLSSLIELDTAHYDMFDLPPVREYELYMRNFGRSNTKQAYVQTNEDAVERDVQTEEVDDLDKWTQHPAEDLIGCGGEGITVTPSSDEKAIVSNPEALAKMGRFVERVAQVITVLLDEEKGQEEREKTGDKTTHLTFSQGFLQLTLLPSLAGRSVERACFCPMQPSTFLTLHRRSQQPSPDNFLDGFGLILVWSVRDLVFPQKILACVSQPTCACFSPMQATLVIAGMLDGSVVVWDLREPASLHHSVSVQGQELCIRFPTYDTAGVMEKENHHSPVMAITAVYPTLVRTEAEDTSVLEKGSGLSFQLASVEENAVVNLWVVTEILTPDMAGSEADLGLAPGGRVKLLRSSAVLLDNPKSDLASGCMHAWDIKLSPSDLNHFFVATDVGKVVHGVRFGSRVFPRMYHSEIDSPRHMHCIDFSPFGEPYFLVGCKDGSVHLFHTSLEHPLASWTAFTDNHSVITVHWSQSRPAVFFVLAENSTVYIFDLVETGLGPLRSDQISSGKVTAMAISSDPALIGVSKSQPAQIVLSMDNGCIELHSICKKLRQQLPLELEFLSRYLDRF